MLELIALGVAGAAGVAGHLRSREFVRRRLRFTKLVEVPAVGLAAGVAVTLAAAPVVALLPVFGAGSAILVGAGIGTGVHLGARDARDGIVED